MSSRVVGFNPYAGEIAHREPHEAQVDVGEPLELLVADVLGDSAVNPAT